MSCVSGYASSERLAGGAGGGPQLSFAKGIVTNQFAGGATGGLGTGTRSGIPRGGGNANFRLAG